jgi:toxin FitB
LKYLLDTCLVSELVRKAPDPGVVEWMNDCDEEAAYLSVITVGEIQKGISKLEQVKKRTALQKWLDSELRVRFRDRLLPITEEVAQNWGLLLGEAESKGVSVPAIDALIAATAMTHNLIVVTRNDRDILRAGARVFNPWNR